MGVPQRVLLSSALPSQGHPSPSDKQVLVRTSDPQRPQVSLQVPVFHSDHCPPGVHSDASHVGVATVPGAMTENFIRNILVIISYHCRIK